MNGSFRGSLPRRILVIVAVPVLFQVATLVAIAVHDDSERSHLAAEARSKEVVLSAYRLRALLVDLETGVRGYGLTLDDTFSEPFYRARVEVPREMRRLADLSGAATRPAAARVIRDAQIVLDYQQQSHALIHSGLSGRAIEMIRRREGKRRMDAFRATLQRFLDEQVRLDGARHAAIASASSRSTMLFGAGFLINLAVAATIATYFVRSITARLGVVVENTGRLEAGEALREPLRGHDEIALLDERFHAMAESLERSRRELEEANRNLESFSYSVSHDLRAPLRAIGGYAQMLDEDCGSALDATGRRYVDVIRSEARRLGTLIDDLLMLSRVARAELSLVPVDMEALTREVFAEVSHGTSVSLAIAGGLPPALADRILVRQVLINLLGNAVKFSRGARTPVVEISAIRDDGINTYLVRDHGVGFDPRFANKLFGVFQRLHSNEEFEGTGVGLAIVKRVVRRLGGDVHAQSQPGEGATFFFTLPDGSSELRGTTH